MTRIALGLLVLLATALPAQQGVVRLPPANARPSTEFSELTSIRELRDGRVLIFDRKENWLAVVNLTDGSMKQISRYGRGPGEFDGALALFQLGGDSTLAADLARRWLIVVGDSVVATLPPDNPGVRAVSLWPLGADKQGRVVSRAIRRESGLNDSMVVLLIERATGRSDTIARLRSGVRRTPVSGGRVDRISRLPLDVGEAPLLLPDGWTAVVRLDPYRVDWRSPDGAWTLGRPVPDRPVGMNASERKAYSDRYPGYRNATDWPELLPPFDSSRPLTLLSTPDGWLVVKRLPSAAAPETRYDVIDKTGTRRSQLVLRANEHILGFGAASVYVIETDDDGIQRLRRHPYSATTIRP